METPDVVKELRERERLGKLSTGMAFPQITSNEVVERETKQISKHQFPITTTVPLAYVAKRKTKEEELKIKDSAIESSINAIAITDMNGNISYVNRSFLEMWGYADKQEVLGRPAVKFWQMKGQYVEIMDRLMAKGGWVGELVAERKNGTPFDVHLSSTMVKDAQGESLCMMASFVDITEGKRAKKALADLNKNLEEKVKERTDQVEKLLRQKDEFIGQLGHDIKTPLTPLVTLLPIIKKKEQDPKLRELLDVTINNVSTMKELVVKTLELARLNSEKTTFDLQGIDLLTIIKDCITTQQSLYESHNIIIQNNIVEPLIAKAEKLHIQALIDNLLKNAIKFTPIQGKITIDADEDENTVTISIRDTGIGLTKEQLERVFDEFYKADNSRHDIDGSGLGLAICKRIVERYGGKIWAESPGLGKGSIFSFMLQKAV